MTEPGSGDERISALEADVAALRSRLSRAEQDAAAARILAGGADRDVGEVRHEFREFRDQNNRVLSAMREDLTDLRAHVDRGFEQVDRNFLAVHDKIDGVTAGLQVITDLLTRRERDDPPRS
jgi:predicted  nucleic acid-binding Zn-ribbon protein